MILDRRTWVVTALGVAQTLAWASSYYLPAILASPMARDLGVSTPTVFAAFSAALVLSAVIGPRAGRAIDLWGGRPVLMITNVVFAAGLVVLASAHGIVVLFIGWLIIGIGIGMGSGFYGRVLGAGPLLRSRCTRADHRRDAPHRFRKYRRLAAVDVVGGALGLARRVYRVGGAARRALTRALEVLVEQT